MQKEYPYCIKKKALKSQESVPCSPSLGQVRSQTSIDAPNQSPHITHKNTVPHCQRIKGFD